MFTTNGFPFEAINELFKKLIKWFQIHYENKLGLFKIIYLSLGQVKTRTN